MDFTPTEAQSDLAQLVGEVCAKLVTADRLRELDRDGRFDDQLWKALAETGVLAAALPESLSGNGFGVLEQAAILRELGRVVAAVPYLWSSVLGAGALAEFGTAEQRELAEQAGTGDAIVTVALAPEQEVIAVADCDGGWAITGRTNSVPYLDRAARVLVVAKTSDGPRVFVVDPSVESVRSEAQQVVDFTPEFLVDFDATPAQLLGDASDAVASWLAERAWLGLAATQLGVLERAMDLTAEHTRTREQFGKAIGAFQSVAQRLSDAYIDVQGLRLAVTQAAWRLSEGLPATESVHIAKFWAAEAGHRVAHTAIHLHGGIGIDRDHIAHNYFTAAKHHEFALGGATCHLLALGAELAKD
ncbi:acyl-CoA dehydrogenase family protein [Nocardia camponoti]|uniref:Acyl-CoA dehydrogenase n=1 Tax=Nocardia camponoti TaxID=1616106 RepID=A0A917QP11_9NOCA|nr:acyl-CoA dehydrogenase family protein [Nocardia camponoti]GGK59541.1 putative acyl-CoA dehydrogenase [Nocardia camponoti]